MGKARPRLAVRGLVIAVALLAVAADPLAPSGRSG
jgi:hypothetical protein